MVGWRQAYKVSKQLIFSKHIPQIMLPKKSYQRRRLWRTSLKSDFVSLTKLWNELPSLNINSGIKLSSYIVSYFKNSLWHHLLFLSLGWAAIIIKIPAAMFLFQNSELDWVVAGRFSWTRERQVLSWGAGFASSGGS